MMTIASNNAQRGPTVQSLLADGYEKVHTETNWYDGPRSGTADIGGAPHFFVTDTTAGAPEDQFLVWPIQPDILELERRNYAIFVEWRQRFDKGEADTASHPLYSKPGSEYDTLARQLLSHRNPPADADRRTAKWHRLDGPHHTPEGPGYLMKWSEA